MVLYMNYDTLQVFNEKELYQFFIKMENSTPGFVWKSTPDRPSSGTAENGNILKLTFNYILNGKPNFLTILQITK